MDIDLRDRNISRLCFSADETSGEEADVASSVSVLQADHNHIQHVRGLDAVFVNLVELRLAHNQLGRASTPYYRVDYSARGGDGVPRRHHCVGVASWIQALPSTLEVLDVAHNHLHSFLECTCSEGGDASQDRPVGCPPGSDAQDQLLREERHRCPFAVSLFFTAARFPCLHQLHLSHNAFAVSLRESDEMQTTFDRHCPALLEHEAAVLSASETLTLLDLSSNRGIAAVNAFLLSGLRSTESEKADGTRSPVTCTVNVSDTAVEDLQGLSAMSLYRTSAVWSLRLHPTPVSFSVLTAPPPVLRDLLQMVVSTLEDAGVVETLLPNTPVVKDSLSRALTRAEPTDLFFDQLEDAVRAEMASGDFQLPDAAEFGERWTVVLVYVCLLHQVVPSLATVDDTLSVTSCERLLVASMHRLLLADAPLQRRMPMSAAPPLHPPVLTSRGLGGAASAVAPELRSRVIVQHGAPHADPTAQTVTATVSSDGLGAAGSDGGDGGVRPGRFQAALAALRPSRSQSATTPSLASSNSSACEGVTGEKDDCFTPAGLGAEDRQLYETLCRESRELQAAVLASNERCRDVCSQCDALRRQLTQDRSLVADQGREVTRLREERAQLRKGVERQRQRLEKRQREVGYGVAAIQSREAVAREKAAMERVAAREKAVAKRERQLRQRAARTGVLTVDVHGDGATGGQRTRLRSEVLREAAVRKRLAEQENRDPLAYAPAPFKSDVRRATPRTSPDQKVAPPHGAPTVAFTEEERAYFGLYGALTAPALQDVAEHYVAQLPAMQQQQLREASAHLPSSGSRGSSALRRAASPSGGSPYSDDVTAGGSNVAGLSTSPDAGRDLSSLSLSELLDAAAAIRQKQLALQQLHQQWRQPQPALPPPPPPTLPPPLKDAAEEEEEEKRQAAHLENLSEPAPAASSLSTEADREASQGVPRQHVPRTAHANSPFRTTLSEAPPPPPPPHSAQQLFDMVLAQRESPRPCGREEANNEVEAAPPTRSPFSTERSEELPAVDAGRWRGTSAEYAEEEEMARSVSTARPPQINRALFR